MKALTLVADLCYSGIVENENCLDFIYYQRERSRPRYTETGTVRKVSLLSSISMHSHCYLEMNCLPFFFSFSHDTSVDLKQT